MDLRNGKAGEVLCFYKPQGIVVETHSQFCAEEFVWIIMNEEEKDVFKQYDKLMSHKQHVVDLLLHGVNIFQCRTTNYWIFGQFY